MTTLAQLADLVGGEVVGDGSQSIAGAATLRDAVAGQISLVDQAEKLAELRDSAATAVVLLKGLDAGDRPAIAVSDVHAAFTKIVAHFRPARAPAARGIHPTAVISLSAQLGNNVSVGPNATIGDDCVIGDGSTIHAAAHIMAGCKLGQQVTVYPSAVLYEECVIGNRVTIHAGAVVGSFGFGYSQVAGRHVLSAQLGWVEVGNDVEIGAGTTIDRGTYGPTVIGEGSKFDNQVQVGHNVRIGRHNLLCAQVGIGGSSTTGDYVVMGGQCGIRDHVNIGKGAVLTGMAGVSNHVPEGACMMGIPATPIREQHVKQAALSKLPEMRAQFRELMRQVADLRERLGVASDKKAA
jgi:UDP-3-O-[3-hydroxymyristoyl] glucosamine N-acyltransferase